QVALGQLLVGLLLVIIAVNGPRQGDRKQQRQRQRQRRADRTERHRRPPLDWIGRETRRDRAVAPAASLRVVMLRGHLEGHLDADSELLAAVLYLLIGGHRHREDALRRRAAAVDGLIDRRLQLALAPLVFTHRGVELHRKLDLPPLLLAFL